MTILAGRLTAPRNDRGARPGTGIRWVMSVRTSRDPADVHRVCELAEAARTASRRLALLSRAEKDAALHTLAGALDASTDDIVAANERDLKRGQDSGMAESLLDRLRLDAGQ